MFVKPLLGERGLSAPHAPDKAWSPDSLFNLERTLFAVFFMSDMSSSSSSFVSGEVEGVAGGLWVLHCLMCRLSLQHREPSKGL